LALLVAAITISAMPGVVSAQSAGEAIEARRGLMKGIGKNMGVVANFVKKNEGTTSAVAMSARVIASNLAQLPNHYPAGTAQGSGAGNTRAKAEIWTNWAGFAGGAAKGTDLALKLAMAADTGDKGAIGAAMGELGKGCGGCHKAFRGPKN
jgi:cytochrome c556